MKTTLLARAKRILSLSPILTAVFLAYCYSGDAAEPAALLSTQKANIEPERTSAAQSWLSTLVPPLAPRSDGDRDPEYIKKRREYLDRLFGSAPATRSPNSHARDLDAAGALPPSPLLRGRMFTSPMVFPPWAFPLLPPIQNGYGGNASAMVIALAVHPTNHDIVYTGSYAGLAKTLNAGAPVVNWSYLSNDWDSQEIGSIAIDPIVPDYVYVATGPDHPARCVGLYRSFNGGSMWVNLGRTVFAGTVIRTVAVDRNDCGSTNATTVYVANARSDPATAGLWRSTNSGSDWTRLRPGSYVGAYDVAIDASTNPSTIYVAESDGVYKGVLSGVNWTWTRIYVGNWPDPISGGGKLNLVNGVLYLRDPSPPNHADNLSKWTGVPFAWTRIPTNCPPGGDSCWYPDAIGVWVFAVNPADPRVIVIGNLAAYRTTDEGQTWTEIGQWWGPDIHTDQRAIAFAPDNSGVVYDGNDGGVVRSSNSGQSWVNCNQNLPGALLYSVALSRDDSMIAGTQDNGALFSDKRAPWYSVHGGDDGRSLIDPVNSSTAYFVRLWYKEWFRLNWNVSQVPIPIYPPITSDPGCSFNPAFALNPNPAYPGHLVTACQQVVRSTDGGNNWTPIGLPLASGTNWWDSVNSVYEAPSNPNVIYAVAQDFQKVFVTFNANNGSSAIWYDIYTGRLPAGTRVNAVVVHPTNPQTAYLACNYSVYKTIDASPANTHWTNLNAPSDRTYSDLAIDPANPNNIFVASDFGAFAYTGTWTNISAGIPAGMYITALSFNATSRQLAASTYGRGVYVLDLDDVLPTVSITSPLPNATVFATIAVSATASDNHAVVGVQFKLDGANLGNEDMASPYSITWNTRTTTNGNHTLTAVARDPAGNTRTSSAVNVKVANP